MGMITASSGLDTTRLINKDFVLMTPNEALRRERGACELLAGLTVLAVTSITWSAPSHAQSEDTMIQEVVVTATRVQRSGFEAPTPTTIVSKEEFDIRGTTNFADFLNELPAFVAETTPRSTGLFSVANASNTLNLRGLGANRTLVLVNGRRHVPTQSGGTVNVQNIPTAIIERAEVVTGGASAAWGSDAVAGVVNLIFNKDLEGLRVNAQYGVASEGDAEDYLASFAFGEKVADGRGHFIIAGEYQENKGVTSLLDRDWTARYPGLVANPADTGPNDGIPALIHANNVGSFIATPGGHTLGPFFVRFGPAGEVLPFEFGSIISGTLMVGGDGGHFDNAISVPYERKNIMSTLDYELLDDLRFFGELSYSNFNSKVETIQTFTLPATIRAENPFIPDDLQPLLAASGVPAFGLFRMNPDLGFLTADTENDTFRAVFGLEGDLASNWTWEAYYQYGKTTLTNKQLNNIIVRNMALATDAVRDPSTNEIVCRAFLEGIDPNCVPINLFGFGSPSRAAINYVTGTEFLESTFEQQVIAGTIQGDLFDNWAGPVTAAFGVEYREDESGGAADEIALNNGYLILNQKPIFGSQSVKEGFVETVFPLLKDKPFAKSLDLNAAVRYTDYSLAGEVTTWKVGATYLPTTELHFRGTVSRDIRAPALNELYSPGGLTFFNAFDPFTGNTTFTRVLTSGNLTLTPEEADTQTFGVVYEPGWAPGLGISADWFNVEVADAISGISPQEIINRCFQGEQNFCDFVIRNPANEIVEVHNAVFNVAEQRIQGVDFETRYNFSLDTLFGSGAGDMSVRLLGTRMTKYEGSADGTVTVSRLGDLLNGLPKWHLATKILYNQGPFSFFTQVRYVGDGKQDVTLTAEDIDENSIDAQWYVDLSARIVLQTARRDIEFYAGINNALDNDPPQAIIDFLQPVANQGIHHDVIGRFFYGGIRVSF
jgi:outer membrane receptor protein involved in Fe transport